FLELWQQEAKNDETLQITSSVITILNSENTTTITIPSMIQECFNRTTLERC
ncbi:18_t:CDS:1, partial [Funneliformis geosporum]